MRTYIAIEFECFKNIAYNEILELYAVSVDGMGWMSWMDHTPVFCLQIQCTFQDYVFVRQQLRREQA